MNASSKPGGMRARAAAAALVLTLVAVPAFADNDERRNDETTPVDISSHNPCYGPADPVTKEHPGEPIQGSGTQRTQTHEKTKRDGTMETRTHTKINGTAVGAVSQAVYWYDNHSHTNLRFRPNGATRFISRSREDGIPDRARDAAGNPVPRFTVITREEMVFDPANPAKNRATTERDDKCRDKHGRDRCNDSDGHRDHSDHD
jgi:hypothetical protein